MEFWQTPAPSNAFNLIKATEYAGAQTTAGLNGSIRCADHIGAGVEYSEAATVGKTQIIDQSK